MYIFYDFETSSRELLGQILSYAFIVTDRDFNPVDECCGTIRLNRTQLPDIEAIVVNQLNLENLQQTGIPEWEAAEQIFNFLNDQLNRTPICNLVGFNSNQFDLNFLRNLLIRYGLNPYFRGKLHNVDLLHFSQALAFEYPDRFPWHTVTKDDGNRYFGFTLEALATQFKLLDQAQTHDARDDVLLCIELVKTLEKTFGTTLADFRPMKLPVNTFLQDNLELGKQKVRDFPQNGQAPLPFVYRYWLKIISTSKTKILLDLDTFKTAQESGALDDEAILKALKYFNPNKAFLHLDPLDSSESKAWETTKDAALDQPFLKGLTEAVYFEKIKKSWDIEYQIHDLGFERIDQLRPLILALLADPNSHNVTLRHLLEARKDPKDTALIQLYNRAYLNIHPDPNPEYLQRYLVPRYVTGSLLKDPQSFVSLAERLERLMGYKEQTPKSSILEALETYYLAFIGEFGLSIS
ncbi:MAG: hypothetical protein AB7F28_07960 [Candidatus Margulisiibacteriota bacterium]